MLVSSPDGTLRAGTPIDASTVYFDGTPLDGVASLRTVLLAKPEVLVGTMAEKLLTYALGRGLEPSAPRHPFDRARNCSFSANPPEARERTAGRSLD